MVKIRISPKFKKELDLIKAEYIRNGKKPPTYEQIIKQKIKNKNDIGILYNEVEFF